MGAGSGSSRRSAGRTGSQPSGGGGAVASPENVPESPAVVQVWDLGPGYDEKAVRAEIKAIFGKDLSLGQIASLSGAYGREFSVSIRRDFPGKLTVEATAYINGANISLVRDISRGQQGPKIYNSIFTAGKTGGGIGTKVLASQVRAAGAAGVAQISTSAARSNTYVGYYVWARLGFDAPISGTQATKASKAVGYKVSRISDLMRTPQGRQWWKKQGTARFMTFDPTPGSASRQRLDQYQQERATRSN